MAEIYKTRTAPRLFREAVQLTSKTAERATRLPRRVARLSLYVARESSGFAVSSAAQVMEMARVRGLPIPTMDHSSPEEREHDRHIADDAMAMRGICNVFLKATNMKRRGIPYAVEPDKVHEVLVALAEETGIAPVEVLDPHAGQVVQATLED